MKRIIVTYTPNPDVFSSFIDASKTFLKETRENNRRIREYSIHTNNETVSHTISFESAEARRLHEQSPGYQVFSKLANKYCDGQIVMIELPEDGILQGITHDVPNDTEQAQKRTNLYKSQDDIENIQSLDK
jgi:quinol monooxygenase YgiN